MNIKNIYLRLIALGDDPADAHMVDLLAHIDAPDDQAGMLTAFRHAANSLGIEAGVIVSHVPHADAQASITGDHYFLELISEAELRFRKLSVRFERLRAAAVPATQVDIYGGFKEDAEALDALQDALGDGTPITVCTECTRVYEAHRRVCPYCQHNGTSDSLAIESNQASMDRAAVIVMTAAMNEALALHASRWDEIDFILRQALTATEVCRDGNT
jgi:hypothetical protein